MGKSQRRKGHGFEREVVRLFRDIFPEDNIARGFQYRAGEEAPDVDYEGLWIECKVGARPNLLAALKQAEQAAKDGRVPVAICKKDRQAPTATLRLSDFLEFLRVSKESDL